MTVEITRATLDDLEPLLPLVSGYRVFYKQDVDAERERAFIQFNLANSASIIFIARVDGEAVGFAQLYQVRSTVRLKPVLLLEDLFVTSNARKLGVASELLARSTDYMREIGAAGMFLETAMTNETAQGVYERNGWMREAEFYKYNAPLS